MADYSALQQQIAADPDVQAMVAFAHAHAKTAGAGGPDFEQMYALLSKVNQKYKASGVLPKDVAIMADGSVHEKSWIQKHGAELGAGLLAGGIAGGALLGGEGAAAAGGAAADSTAALGPVAATGGTTAATVPPALASGGGGILGSLGKYGGILGDLGSVVGNAAAADANGRRQDQANNARAIADNNVAKTGAAKFNLDLPSVRTNQVARGEVLNTMQNAPATGDPRIDKFSGGGLRPSAFGPQSRQAGSILASTAMNGLQHPETDRLTPQEIPMSSASTLDNIGAGAGLGLDIFSLLSKYGRNPNNVTG